MSGTDAAADPLELEDRTGIDAWEQPIPLDEYEVPPFPTGTLPGWLGRYVSAVAHAAQVPEDLPGTMGLVVVAASLAGRFCVRVDRNWIEPLNLYSVTFLPPGARKSTVFRMLTAPLTAFEREENERRAPLIARSESDLRTAQEELKLAERQAARDPSRLDDARALSERVKAMEQDLPREVVLSVDDCSPEKLVGILKEQGGRLAILSPEGGAFQMMAGKYTKNGGLADIYLKGHPGDRIRVDRQGRTSEMIESPALSIGICAQPGALAELINQPGFRERGLLGRFLWAIPRSNLGSRSSSPPPIPEDVEHRYSRSVERLLQIGFAWDEPAAEGGVSGATAISFCSCARESLRQFQDETELKLGPQGSLGHMTDWGGKLAGAVARLAALLTLAQRGADGTLPREELAAPIPEEAVAAAIALARYFEMHALATYGEIGADPELDGARRILSWIAAHPCDTITQRDLHVALRRHFVRSKQLDGPLTILAERGYIRLIEAPPKEGAGRPPGPVFAINPLGICTQNTQNHGPGGEHR